MGKARILVILAIVGFAGRWWIGRNEEAPGGASASTNGFVSVAMPEGARASTVVILAPMNCSSAEAQRADTLAQELSRAGVPNVRSSSYSASVQNPTADQGAAVQRAVTVLNGEVPAVFLNDMAKSNPSLEEVISEYQRTK